MNKVKTQKIFLLTSNVVYQDKQHFEPLTLRELPKKNAVSLIANLLHQYNIRQKTDIKFQINILRAFITEGTSALQQIVMNFFGENPGLEDDNNLKFIDRRSFLNLLQNLLVYADDISQLTLTPDNIDVLFRNILLLNQEEARAQEIVFKWDHSQQISDYAEQILPTQFRSIEIERLKDYKTQFLKVYYFFEFCQANPKYAEFLNTFLTTKGVSSYSSYLWKIFSLSLELIEEGESREVIYAKENTELARFLENYIINDKIVSIDNDFRTIRSYPFYKLNEDYYQLLNYNFFIDKFYQGFLFDFASATELSFGNLRNDMGRLFSEPSMFYQVMQNCFGNYGNKRLAGNELNLILGSAEPDYYIRKDNDIFVFEFKDLIINAEIKNAGDSEIIKSGLYKKLEENAQGKPKGITQLINTIYSIKDGKYNSSGVDDIDLHTARIYPIIVHSDAVLESFGVNYFLTKRFKEKLSVGDVKNVEDVVLVNVDTLIQMQDHFSSQTIELKNLIDTYHYYIQSEEAPTATFPFDEYIKHEFGKTHKNGLGVPMAFLQAVQKLQRTAH